MEKMVSLYVAVLFYFLCIVESCCRVLAYVCSYHPLVFINVLKITPYYMSFFPYLVFGLIEHVQLLCFHLHLTVLQRRVLEALLLMLQFPSS